MLCWLLGLIGLMKNKKRKVYCEKDQNQAVNVDSIQNKQLSHENPDSCPNCGTWLNEKELVQYCPYCGIKVGNISTIQT